MQRTELWKVLTLGLAMVGLGFVGAGTAFAENSLPPTTTVSTVLADDDDDWDDWYDDDWDDWGDD